MPSNLLNENVQYRYRGPVPYEDKPIERKTFFGREAESKKLLSLTLAERLVVLFSKSGIGKTSLINAGLMEPLRNKNYFPVRVTFNLEKVGILDSIYLQINEKAAQTGIKIKSPAKAAGSLWRYFYFTRFFKNGKPQIPVLILDQFEEVFKLYSKEESERLIEQLSSIVRNNPPHEAYSGPGKISLDDNPNINIKIIIGIREDCLAHLQNAAVKIPQILKNRFRLLPMNHQNAKKAIENPVRMEGEFNSPNYEYTPEAVEGILDFLGTGEVEKTAEESQAIEPSQLQLICQSIENKVLENSIPNNRVGLNDIGGEKGLQRIIKNYYLEQLKKIHISGERKKAEKLFKKGLISPSNNRISLARETIVDAYKITENTLNILVNTRLLRCETRNKVQYYELPHDTLVAPIRQIQRESEMKKIPLYIGLPILAIVLGLTFAHRAREGYYWIQMNRIKEARFIYDQESLIFMDDQTKASPNAGNKKVISDIDREKYAKYIYYAIQADRFDEALSGYKMLINLPQFKNEIELIYNLTKAPIPTQRRDLQNLLLLETAGYYRKHRQNADPFFLFKIAKELYDNDNKKQAAKIFAMALALKDNFNKDFFVADVYYHLGNIAYVNNQCNKAVAYYEKARALKPGSAQFAAASKQPCQTIKKQAEPSKNAAFDEALLQSQKDKPGHNALTKVDDLLTQKNYTEARKALNELKVLDKTVLYFYNGLIYGAERNYSQAIHYFNLSLESNPGFTKALHYRAYYYYVMEEYARSLEDYKALSDRYPENLDYLFSIAACYYNQNNAIKSVYYYEKILAMDKKNAAAYYQLGRAYKKLEADNDAIKNYTKAIELKPDYYEAYLDLAEIYRSFSNYTKALRYYKKAYSYSNKLYIKFRLADVHREYGIILNSKNEFMQAAEQYYNALKYNEFDTKSMDLLGYLYFSGSGFEKDYEQAYALFNKSADLQSKVAQYFVGLNYYDGYTVSVNYAKAWEYWNLSANAGYAEAQYRLGMMYKKGVYVKVDYKQAYKWFSKAAGQMHVKAAIEEKAIELKSN